MPVERTAGSHSLARRRSLAALVAVAQGAKGIGPVTQPEQFAAAMKDGLSAVTNGEVCVIDARVLPGYDSDASGERPPGRG